MKRSTGVFIVELEQANVGYYWANTIYSLILKFSRNYEAIENEDKEDIDNICVKYTYIWKYCEVNKIEERHNVG